MTSYFLDLDGMATKAASNTRSPHFQLFHGLDTDQFLTETPEGYAYAYITSTLIHRCIRVMSNAISDLPILIQTTQNKPLPSQHRLVRDLDNYRNARLWRTTVRDMMIFGQAYWLPTRNGLQRLNPLTVEPVYDFHEGIKYFKHHVMGRQMDVFQPNELIFFFDYHPFEDLSGLSPVQVALRSAGIEISIDRFVEKFFKNDATPAGILTTSRNIDQAEQERVASYWRRLFQGAENWFKVAVLGRDLEFQQLTSPIKELMLTELRQDTAHSICRALDVPLVIALATEASNYSTMVESHRLFYTSGVLPLARLITSEINRQLVPFYHRQGMQVEFEVQIDKGEIDVLQESRAEISNRGQAGFSAGILTLNDARDLENLDPIEGGDFIQINGRLITVKDIEAGKLNPPEESGGGSFMSTPLVQSGYIDTQQPATKASKIGPVIDRPPPREDPDEVLPVIPVPSETIEEAVPVETMTGYVIFNLSNNPSLFEATQHLRDLDLPGVIWDNPTDYHCTLLCCHNMSAQQQTELMDRLPSLPSFDLFVTPVLGSFEVDDGYSLHLRLDHSSALIEFQDRLLELAEEIGCEISNHSRNYIPHISVGTSIDSPTALPPLTKSLAVRPYSLVFSIESSSDTPFRIASVKSVDYEPVIEDLRTWKRFVLKRKSNKQDFGSRHIPRSLKTFLNWSLEGAFDADRVRQTFDSAIKALRTSEPNDVTLEEFEEYWQEFDGDTDSLEGVLTEYLDKVRDLIAEKLAAGVSNIPVDDLNKFAVDHLVGDSENPGPLVAVFNRGFGRGGEVLDRRMQADQGKSDRPNPVKATMLLTPETIDPREGHAEAFRWLNTYALDLVQNINETSKQKLRDTLGSWTDSGGSLEDLAKAIQGELEETSFPDSVSPQGLDWLTSRNRARLIAQTETTTVFNRGVGRKWESAGVSQVRWRTQNDGRVCPICDGLHNRVGSIKDGIRGDSSQYYRPPAHPGCRCFWAPIIED